DASWPGNFAQNYKTVLCHAVNCSSTIADVEGVRELTERFPACVLVGTSRTAASWWPRCWATTPWRQPRRRSSSRQACGSPWQWSSGAARIEAGQRPRGRGVVAECEGQGSGATIGGMIDSVGRFSGMSAPGNRDKVF
ncbi:unnamed protein product, partial [Prorocentrum cordatum]